MSEVEATRSDDESSDDGVALAMAPPSEVTDRLFEAIVVTNQKERCAILVPEAIERQPALGEVRVAAQAVTTPGGKVTALKVLVRSTSRGYAVLFDTELSGCIQPVCKEIGDALKKHEPDREVLREAPKARVKAFTTNRDALNRVESPIDVGEFTKAFKTHLQSTYGLLELDSKVLHFDGGVLEVKYQGGVQYTLEARGRTPTDCLSADTCLPYSIDWIKAALDEMELTEDMQKEVEETREVFQTLVPKHEDQQMLLAFYGAAFFLDLAEQIKYVLLFVGPANCGKTTLAYLLAWISGTVNQVPASAISKGAKETQKDAARKAAGGHRLGLMEDYSLGEFDASALKDSAKGAPLCIQNRWTGRPEEIRSPFLAVTLNPEHMPSIKPHGDVASKFLLFDATKHMQQFAPACAAASSAATVTMVGEFKKKAIDGDYAGPMAYLALSQLSGRSATFSIELDMSAYVTDAVRTESEAWQVGDPEREQKEAAAAVAEPPLLDVYRAVVVQRPDDQERGLGVSMVDALQALHKRRPEGEARSPVLLYVCGDEATYDVLLRGGGKLTSVRQALTDLHSRAHPQQATWINYNTKDGPRPSGCPYIKDGADKKKYLITWACRGFMVADA